MTPVQISAQVINLAGTALNSIGITKKEKDKTLIFFTLGNICVATALGLLGAISGMTIQIIFVTQTIINFFYEKKHDSYPKWMIGAYVVIPTIILSIVYQSAWDLMPIAAGILFPLALISKNTALRIFNFLSVAMWIPYNLHFGQYVGAISCAVFAVINLIAIIRFDIMKTKLNEKEN